MMDLSEITKLPAAELTALADRVDAEIPSLTHREAMDHFQASAALRSLARKARAA